jgi:hypothetical protein
MKTTLKLLAFLCFLTLVTGCGGGRFDCDYFPNKSLATKDNIKAFQEGIISIARKYNMMMQPLSEECLAFYGQPHEGPTLDKKEKNPGLSVSFWTSTGIVYVAQQNDLAEAAPTHKVRMDVEALYAKIYGKDGYASCNRVLDD